MSVALLDVADPAGVAMPARLWLRVLMMLLVAVDVCARGCPDFLGLYLLRCLNLVSQFTESSSDLMSPFQNRVAHV